MLIGTNRHTITLSGWSHEQDNLKVVTTSPSERSVGGTLRPNYIVRGREIGLNRYERIEEFDFSPAINYCSATKEFWKLIRNKWQEIIASGKTYILVETTDESFLMGAMMAADQIFIQRKTRGQMKLIWLISYLKNLSKYKDKNPK